MSQMSQETRNRVYVGLLLVSLLLGIGLLNGAHQHLFSKSEFAATIGGWVIFLSIVAPRLRHQQ